MLQIRLNPKAGSSSDVGGLTQQLPVETVTVACPDHLVIADLPVAKSLGSVTATSLVKIVGRRSRRQLGERVHFCVRCDFPIAIYGRLSPCEHAFCLDCARSDSICYLCDERIQKIQTIKMMEGIFICAAPHCLKSFLKRMEFESHIHSTHADLLPPNAEKEDRDESEAFSTKQSTASDSTIRAPPRPIFSPNSSSQLHDRDDKARRQQPREPTSSRPVMPKQPPFYGQVQNHPSEPPVERPPGFDRSILQSRFPQQNFDVQTGGQQQESGLFPDKQQGVLPEASYPEYPPMHAPQQPNFVVPINPNPMLTLPPPFHYPSFPSEGAQQMYTAPYEISLQDSAPEVGSAEQGSLLGFPPGPASMSFAEGYTRPWGTGPGGMPFEPPTGGQLIPDGFINMSDSQGRAALFQGDYGQNAGVLPQNPLPLSLASKGMESMQGGSAMASRDSKGILAPQPGAMPPPPPPPGPHPSQLRRGKFESGGMSRDGQSYAWQHEQRDNFSSGPER
ncbi:hypothetical protein RJ641_028441 [Dillenia turbinata]|uniref:RING-type E3 ubiquitin transferase n=1 Tax=Dillenia turbinata TaxID=194707 RepID=A0AAN8ZJ14_9MAGN